MMKEASIHKYCIIFHGGRTNVQDQESSGWLSVVIDGLRARIEAKL